MKKSLGKNWLLFIFYFWTVSNANAQDHIDNFAINISGFIDSNTGFRTEKNFFDQSKLPDAQIVSNKTDSATGTDNKMNNNPDFTNEAEIRIKVSGANQMAMKYGAIMELQANTSSASRNEGFNVNKAFIFAESQIGKLEFGNNSAVNHKMKVGPESLARGAGGINGKYLEYINLPMLADSSQLASGRKIGNCDGYRIGANGNISQAGSDCSNIKLPRFILIPESPIAHGGYAKGFYNRIGDNQYDSSLANDNLGFNRNRSSSQVNDGQLGELEDASKISYYTPRISGWQFGVSFAPSTSNTTTSAAISADNGDIKQALSYGLNYSDNFDNLGLAISATGENGELESNSASGIKANNLKAYDIGFMAAYFGFTIGASYGNWGNSLQPKSGIYSCNYNSAIAIDNQNCSGIAENKFSDATYYTAGIAYQFGHFATSITYLNSNFQENRYKAISAGFDYKITKGLMPYFEVTKYDFHSNQPKALGLIDQSTISNNSRQLKDNSGYVALAGLLFSF